MNIIGASPGWAAGLILIDGEHDPNETGIRVATKVGSDPAKNEKAAILKSILARGGLNPRNIYDHQIAAGQTKLVIGVHP